MLIGVDFDNTIVSYDRLIYKIALKKGLIPKTISPDKEKIRNHLRLSGKEDLWTELQGYIYGVGIKDCPVFPGALKFLQACKQQGVKVFIISHKTLHPFKGPKYDLHLAAYSWLKSHGFYDTPHTGLSEQKTCFVLTKQEKLNQIADKKCEYFIDDLPEFLEEPGFPAGVKRILFDPNSNYSNASQFVQVASWAQIHKIIMGRRDLI